ncbi:Murein tripeptide amidase MpaA [Streptoalloteichus tenebrarius]|uniref:Murein tripeptide amidase MpaA n=1 Tax=Streptoalloteichus tenebrarius (strain ATCC 17920 / DSM 40477 / JCM 4838 / CBS 697.72 / NBRC 16177 / NCIMB 11028 / NRRL B-12390 / A12253. 1 / ISP 5477) TaxID=1933 RepID=A0ABT1HNE0_STRSD|nr:M14 family metallopeptidase [Streptoalloteichus tenebrarius]MCP2257008.1 Murein tripeptide amidase MpaA [Streptoalloteichus tenebrarius]BFF00080.1 M14 family metallopeptidase [Streptoalloteichus tenebrarius]
MLPTRRRLVAAAVGACLSLLVPLSVAGADARWAAGTPSSGTAVADSGRPHDLAVYQVHGATSPEQRTTIARTGVDVLGVANDRVTVTATPEQAAAVRAAGFRTELVERVPGADGPTTLDFPPNDSNYHNYTELTAELRNTASSHSSIAALSSVGKSHQGRDLWLLKISDNVAVDEDEPEVLFTCNQHAREHLTVEMCLRIVQRFTTQYATDPAIKKFVDTREIYVISSVNPDGAEYDVASGRYQGWRKNRQPAGGSVGTDPNRNWGYKWGCCGGSSGSASSETYRGPSAFSAPETARVRDFVNSRVVGGKQQITAHIDFHTYSELILWPYGYTYDDTAPGLSADDARTFSALGRQMAQTNGYTPQQSSDLYVTDGSVNDWMWGQHKIWSYTFEMYPRSSSGLSGFYPPDEVIPRETARNDKAVDLLVSYADCVPRVIGKTC